MKVIADRKEINTALFSSSVGWRLCSRAQWYMLHVLGSIQKWKSTFQDLASPTNSRNFRGTKKKKRIYFHKNWNFRFRHSSTKALPQSSVQVMAWQQTFNGDESPYDHTWRAQPKPELKHFGPHTNTQPLHEFLKSQQYGKKVKIHNEVVHGANSRCSHYWFKVINPWNECDAITGLRRCLLLYIRR